MNKIRYCTSIVFSALLWLLLPTAIQLSNDKRTDYGWQVFWSEFPLFLFYSFIVMLVIAIAMHFLFVKQTISLKGFQFWIFPLKSVSLALLFWWAITVVIRAFDSSFWTQSFQNICISLTWSIAVSFIIIFGPFIWITYPLAILNQFMIQRLLGRRRLAEQGAAANP